MPSPLEYNTEYDIQQEIEIEISYVRSELSVQGVASHAGSGALSTVDEEVSKVESKLTAFGAPSTSAGLSATESTVESKLDDMGADYSHADSAGLSTVDSILDAQGAVTHAGSAALSTVDEELSAVESKLDVMGVASLAGSTPLSTVDSVADAVYGAMYTFKTHHYLTKAETDVAISAGVSWTTIFGLTAPSHTLIKALKITNTGLPGGTCIYRITDGTNKLFPYGASLEYDSAEENRLAEPLSIKKDDSYCLEVAWSAADSGSAAMTEMDVIELD